MKNLFPRPGLRSLLRISRPKSSNVQKAVLFSRPMVILQSDDWGRIGVRDGDGYKRLRDGGLDLGSHPYDSYSLETAEDVNALREMLNRHRDSTGRRCCMVMNFLTANLDFERMDGSPAIRIKPLSRGFPGGWRRPGLGDAYNAGVADGVFYPALHGSTHFCVEAAMQHLENDAAGGELLRRLWKAETPYIYWRMPWIGFEYWHPTQGFLEAGKQSLLVEVAACNFAAMFGGAAVSACAPGYRANQATHTAWARSGVKVAQNGSGRLHAPHFGEHELLHLYRTIDCEPAQQRVNISECLATASRFFRRGLPLIISTHSINFHSSIRDFRSETLRLLDRLLSALERQYCDLLYVHDGDLYQLATQGKYCGASGIVSTPSTTVSLAAGAS